MMTSFFFYLAQVSICLSVFYAFYFFFLRKDNFFQINRFYLLFTASLSFLIPLFQIESSVVQPLTQATFLGLERDIQNVIVIDDYASTFSFEQILMSVYLLGFAFMFLKISVSLIYLFRLFKINEKQKNENGYIVFTKKIQPVFSFLNIIFWSNKNTYSEEERKQIILHEQVHIRQKHSLDILFLEFINAVLWFNPFIYFYKKSLKITHEYIADEHLFQQQNFRLDYVSLLMKEAGKSNRNSLPVVHTFFNNQLKQRLIMIKNINKPSSKFKLLGCLPIIALLFASFGIQPTASAQDNLGDLATPTKGDIYVVGDTDNSFTIREDGTRRNHSEIKQYVIAENKAEGKLVTENQIIIITKAEMLKNVSYPSKEESAPKSKGEYRLIFMKSSGTLKLMDMSDRSYLEMKSFLATMKKPQGKDAAGNQEYATIEMSLKSNYSKRIAKLANSLDPSEVKLSSLVISEIVALKNDKAINIPGEFNLNLE